jgi:hypothetical protein
VTGLLSMESVYGMYVYGSRETLRTKTSLSTSFISIAGFIMMKYAGLKWKTHITKHINQLMSLVVLCARKSTSYDLSTIY